MTFRKARKKDVIHIVRMLADDLLGQERENYRDPLPEIYYQAFTSIDKDHNQELNCSGKWRRGDYRNHATKFYSLFNLSRRHQSTN